jgi:hypothetical protein
MLLPAVSAAAVGGPASPAVAKNSATLIPVLYSFPDAANQQAEWAPLYNTGGSTVRYTIANICDNGAGQDGHGPGCDNQPVDQVNPLWTQPQFGSSSLLSNLSQKSITPLGYVAAQTCNPTCTPNTEATVESQMQGYVNEYGIKNFFIDIVPPNDATFACDLYNYATKTIGASVVELNAGSTFGITGSYICGGSAHEILQIWENSSLSGFTMPSWTSGFPSNDFSVTLNGVSTAAAMDSAESAICADRVANFYINDDNLYQNMPSYWSNNSSAEWQKAKGLSC